MTAAAEIRMIPTTSISSIPVHPYAELLPPMADVEYTALVADIIEHGLRQPVVLHDGQILDGRNRARACAQVGVPMATRVLPDTLNAREFVVSQNLRRRNLSASQAAMVAARMVTTRQGAAAGNADVTQEMAAVACNVSPRYVRDAQWLREHNDALASQVFAGSITLASAMRQARPRATSQIVGAEPHTTVIDEVFPEVATPPAASVDLNNPMAVALAFAAWLAAEPRDHAAVLAAFGAQARTLVPALDDFARRLWDAADEEGLLS